MKKTLVINLSSFFDKLWILSDNIVDFFEKLLECNGMKKKYILPLIICASVTTFQAPAFSQQAQGGFFSTLFAPRPAQPANPVLGNMMKEWQKETDPIKKKRLAREIQSKVGVKADGVIGRRTMQAVQQAGGMPPPVSGGNQAGTSVVDFGGSQFKGGTQGQPAQGGFFSTLFAPRPANPALGNKMREWQLEPDPNKKRMIAMEIQRDLGVKADGVIGNQTMQAVKQAGGMHSGGGIGGPAPQGGFGFNPNPNPGGGGMHSGGGMHHGGGMTHGGGGMHHGGGMIHGGGGMHHGGGGMHHGGGGGGPSPGGGGGGPSPGGGGGEPSPGGGGGPKN